MRTIEYLQKIQRYEYMIKDKLDEINRLRELCMSISVSTDKENVKSSPNQDKLADAIAKIVDLERETDNLVDGLIDERRRIINQIDAIGNTTYYKLLTCKYVKGMKIREISEETGYSEAYVKELTRNALVYFEEVYGKTYLSY